MNRYFDLGGRCASCGNYRPLGGLRRNGRCTAMTIQRPQPWCSYFAALDGTQHPLVSALQKKCDLYVERRRQL